MAAKFLPLTEGGRKMKRIAREHAETALEENARRWLNSQGADYDSGVEGALGDLLQGGCQAGTVGHLVYYTDTVKFYKRHQNDIDTMLQEMMSEMGTDGPKGLFGDKWNAEDPLARDTSNRNLLAWFGFEEAARIVASRAGIEV